MDNRKLNTMQVLNSGILDIEPPKSKAPGEDFCYESVEEWEWDEDTLREGLRKIGGLRAYMYYGCWKIWKINKNYNGELMQYCSVTGKFENEDLEYAVEKAIEWATNCQG